MVAPPLKIEKELTGKIRVRSGLLGRLVVAKVPKGCYWQAKGQGRWYTSWRDETGRQRTKVVGDASFTNDELVDAMRCHHAGIVYERDTLIDGDQYYELTDDAVNRQLSISDYMFTKAQIIELATKDVGSITASGVYFLIRCGEIVYVGQTGGAQIYVVA